MLTVKYFNEHVKLTLSINTSDIIRIDKEGNMVIIGNKGGATIFPIKWLIAIYPA